MSNIKNLAEVEIKIELTPLQYRKISLIVLQNGFHYAGTEEQTDYYLNFNKGPEGYDFKRLRVIPGKIAVITEKTWKTVDGEKLRVENEYEISNEEKESLISGKVEYTAKKSRINYTGEYAGYEMHICEDTLFLKKSIRHLLECEIITTLADAKKAKQIVLQWFKEILGMDDVAVAPSILELIMEDSD